MTITQIFGCVLLSGMASLVFLGLALSARDDLNFKAEDRYKRACGFAVWCTLGWICYLIIAGLILGDGQ